MENNMKVAKAKPMPLLPDCVLFGNLGNTN
jgi:hypothetical protein